MAADESVSSSLSPAGASRRASIALSELPEQAVVAVDVELDGMIESVLVIRNAGRCAAYLNACPHAGRRLDYAPGKFLLDGGHLVCAAHGASFRLVDGLCVGGPCRGQSLVTLPAKEEDGALVLFRSAEAG